MNMKMMKAVIVILIFTTGYSWAGFGDFLKESAGQLVGGSGFRSGTNLTESQISAGLKEALSIGADHAINYLGQPGGFLNDSMVKIGLPDSLETIASGLRVAGQGQLVDDFEQTMNRAAELAIPKTLDIVKNTISGMSLEDARGILTGTEDAATRYLRQKAGAELKDAVLPIVSRATAQAGVTASYKQLTAIGGTGMLGGLLGSGGSLDLDSYVADRALDGLYYKLAQEEARIRKDPAARTTDLLKQVFAN